MSRCGRRFDGGCGLGHGKEVVVIIILLLLCCGINC